MIVRSLGNKTESSQNVGTVVIRFLLKNNFVGQRGELFIIQKTHTRQQDFRLFDSNVGRKELCTGRAP